MILKDVKLTGDPFSIDTDLEGIDAISLIQTDVEFYDPPVIGIDELPPDDKDRSQRGEFQEESGPPLDLPETAQNIPQTRAIVKPLEYPQTQIPEQELVKYDPTKVNPTPIPKMGVTPVAGSQAKDANQFELSSETKSPQSTRVNAQVGDIGKPIIPIQSPTSEPTQVNAQVATANKLTHPIFSPETENLELPPVVTIISGQTEINPQDAISGVPTSPVISPQPPATTIPNIPPWQNPNTRTNPQIDTFPQTELPAAPGTSPFDELLELPPKETPQTRVNVTQPQLGETALNEMPAIPGFPIPPMQFPAGTPTNITPQSFQQGLTIPPIFSEHGVDDLPPYISPQRPSTMVPDVPVGGDGATFSLMDYPNVPVGETAIIPGIPPEYNREQDLTLPPDIGQRKLNPIPDPEYRNPELAGELALPPETKVNAPTENAGQQTEIESQQGGTFSLPPMQETDVWEELTQSISGSVEEDLGNLPDPNGVF